MSDSDQPTIKLTDPDSLADEPTILVDADGEQILKSSLSGFLAPGTRINRIVIESQIGQGGMGAVYLAYDEKLQRQVAIKSIRPEFLTNPDTQQRFIREARILSKINHQSICHIYDYIETDVGDFLVLEYIKGKQLYQTSLNKPETLDALMALAEALDVAHQHGVIHRDLKPDNVMVTDSGQIKVLDFGIAQSMGSIQTNQNTDASGSAKEGVSSELTSQGSLVGTIRYMSPEQAQAKVIDHRSDIYSLGVIFSEMLLGSNSFKADSYIETSMNHIQMDIPHLPENLSHYQSILDRMLAKTALERFSNAKAVIYSIDQVQDEGALSAEELSAIKMPKKSLLARFDTAILVIILLSFLSGGGYFFQQAMVAKYLEKAELAYANDRLMLPKDNNAVKYYQQVQRYSPGNKKAQLGLDKVAQRYASWAERSLKRNQKSKAQKYLQRALQASPELPQLLALKAKML